VTMRAWLLQWLLLAFALIVTVALMPGIDVDWRAGSYVLLALLFAVVNSLLGPILRLLSLPVTIVTLGLFALVVNGLLLEITDWLSDSMRVDGFGTAIVGAVVLSIVTAVIAFVVRPLGHPVSRAV
jgi:putative membrane protein